MEIRKNDWLAIEIQAKEFPYQSFFLSSESSFPQPIDYHSQDWLFLAGNSPINTGIQQAVTENPDWYFGHLCYDLKNNIHGLTTQFPSPNYPLQQWIKADWVVQKKEGIIQVLKGKSWQEQPWKSTDYSPDWLSLSPAVSKLDYLNDLRRIQEFIRNGACYELNYCFPFQGQIQKDFNPWSFFYALHERSSMPFANFYQTPEIWALGASPERYLRKKGSQVISQPIKGTRRRCETSDEALVTELQNSEKENAEHVMIVDLMRNDLAKFCIPGSVEVPEFKKVTTFPRVHQMISTVKGSLRDKHQGLDLLFDAFPMGSMTGAPKRRVMEIIDEVEHFSRGLYSGSVGYIQPHGDFDFNVVIRTLVVERDTQKASMGVGGAITFLSNPEEEYEECWVKAAPILHLSKPN
jgi:para-aminobenzoate synthetase component 1